MEKNRTKLLTIIFTIIIVFTSVIHPFAIETPEKTNITYCKSGDEGRLLINWDVVNVDGYELVLSQNNRFTRKTQTLTYDGYRRKASLTNLEKNVVYYVKIRTFNIINNKKIYSQWSNIESVKIHAHNYKRGTIKKATCTESGIYSYFCAECYRSYKEYVPSTEHAYQWISNNDGTMSYTCENCGDIKETKNCNYELINTINATCTEDGYYEYKCKDCNDIKKETIQKLNHEYEIINETNTEIIYTCKNCGDSYSEQKEILNENDQEYTIDLGNGQTTTVVGHFDTTMSEELFNMLNEYRKENNLPELNRPTTVLQDGANLRATEITYTFSHTRPNGERALTSLTGTTRCCAENLGRYQTTTTAVMNDWINSSSHNSNMISKYPTSVAISVFAQYERTIGNQRIYNYHFVQLFGW